MRLNPKVGGELDVLLDERTTERDLGWIVEVERAHVEHVECHACAPAHAS
jgi:hypothetical protein